MVALCFCNVCQDHLNYWYFLIREAEIQERVRAIDGREIKELRARFKNRAEEENRFRARATRYGSIAHPAPATDAPNRKLRLRKNVIT
jgi:trehalose-6-phosphatase